MLDGKKFGQFEVVRKIGEGGMGAVYLAHDKRLDRSVALKVLPLESCCDPEKEMRFKQEARAASALNHPNIITIYDIGKEDGRTFIATELVEGETLRHKIDRRDLTLLEAVEIAEQIASALSAAHEAGIVHRDVKPENIMIRKDGFAKVLDFGLAKMTSFSEVGAEDKTIQLVKTQPGIVLGSVRYMSPEQARGKDVDERTDIWSLGVVLFETIAGFAPFDGESVSDTLANVIHVEPKPLPISQDETSNELQRIIRRALQKDRDERYQTIKDFYLDLKTLRRELDKASTIGIRVASQETQQIPALISDAQSGRSILLETGKQRKITGEQGPAEENLTDSIELVRERRSRRIWQNSFVGVLFLAMLGALAYFSSTLFSARSPNLSGRFSDARISRITNDGQTVMPAISPDGRYVAYMKGERGKASMVVRQLATDSSVEIIPERSDFYTKPVFSPDGNFLYYNIANKAIGTLNKIPTLGGPSRKIIDDIDSAPTFSPDGKSLVFLRNDPKNSTVLVISASSDGTNQQQLLSSKEVGYTNFGSAAWSPDGETLLLVSAKVKGGKVNEPSFSVAEFSFKDRQIRETAAGRFVVINDINWLRDGSGFLLNASDRIESPLQVWLIKYPSGEKSRVTNDVNDYLWLSLSADNTSLVTIKSESSTSFWSVSLNNRESRQFTNEDKSSEGKHGFDVFPDERIVFTQRTAEGSIDLVTMNSDGTNRQTIASSSQLNIRPKVSADGRFIVFVSTRSGAAQLWRMDADGKNPVQLTTGEEYVNQDPQITSDGKFVVFMRMPLSDNPAHIARVSIDGGEVTPLEIDSGDFHFTPRLSPDGKRIAYQTIGYTQGMAESKRAITVRDFIDGEIVGEPKEYDFARGGNFTWNPDGKSLTISNSEGGQNLYSLNLENGQMKQLTNFSSARISNFAWTKNGKKLIVTRANVSDDLILIQSPSEK